MIIWRDEKLPLYLLTVKEFDFLPNGVELESINGEKYTKGIHNIDFEVRSGYIAIGSRDPFNGPNKDIFLLLALRGNQ